jgi:hypothetical protein
VAEMSIKENPISRHGTASGAPEVALTNSLCVPNTLDDKQSLISGGAGSSTHYHTGGVHTLVRRT